MTRHFFDSINLDTPATWVKDTTGAYKIPAKFTRVGVFPYSVGNVLRPADEVFKKDSLETMLNKPLTIGHPEDAVTIKEWDKLAKGIITNVFVDGDIVRGELLVWDAETIELLKVKKELSMGYFAEIVEEKGVYNSKEYDYKQTNIVYNHISVVDRARMGSDITVDSLECNKEVKVESVEKEQMVLDTYEAKIKVLETKIKELTKENAYLVDKLETYEVKNLKEKLSTLGLTADGDSVFSIKKKVVDNFLTLDPTKVYSNDFINGAFNSIVELQNKKIVDNLKVGEPLKKEVEVIDIII